MSLHPALVLTRTPLLGSGPDESQRVVNLPRRGDGSDSGSDILPSSDDGSGMAMNVAAISISDSNSNAIRHPSPGRSCRNRRFSLPSPD